MNRSAKLFYYCVEWDDATCSWDTFRSSLIGPTDPVDAPPDSLRGLIAARWEELGLPGPCDRGDNAVHGSASPFEAMIERCNWLTSASKVLLCCQLASIPVNLHCLERVAVALTFRTDELCRSTGQGSIWERPCRGWP